MLSLILCVLRNGGEAVAQWGNCLPCKLEALSLDSQQLRKVEQGSVHL